MGWRLAFAQAWALGPGPDVGRGHRGFYLWLILVCKPQTLCPTEGPLQPYSERLLGSTSPHGPSTPIMVLPCTGPTPQKGPLFSRACAVCPPPACSRSGWSRLAHISARPVLLRSAARRSPGPPDPPLAGPSPGPHLGLFPGSCFAPHHPSPEPSTTPDWLPGLAVPRSNPERVFLTHLTVSLWPSGPPYCPLPSSAAGAAVMTIS